MMDLTKKHLKATIGVVGTAGAAVLACSSCCVAIPLIGPLLAWLGISSLGAIASGWYVGMASVFGMGVAILFAMRCIAAARAQQAPASLCGCGSACSTVPESDGDRQ